MRTGWMKEISTKGVTGTSNVSNREEGLCRQKLEGIRLHSYVEHLVDTLSIASKTRARSFFGGDGNETTLRVLGWQTRDFSRECIVFIQPRFAEVNDGKNRRTVSFSSREDYLSSFFLIFFTVP